MVIRLGGFGGLSEVHRCLSRFLAHLHICEDSVGARTQHCSNCSVQPTRRPPPRTSIEFLLKAQGHVDSRDVKDLLTATGTSSCTKGTTCRSEQVKKTHGPVPPSTKQLHFTETLSFLICPPGANNEPVLHF
ncbi:unnamed protein product [Pleuronectes platessa]|uniref:Uncharacterized protein n=1 Tax=Pleuronectes platessa TaxID=8262 RepID=A0A9N7YT35_PLEPL|nr:unnamed protein product [Pleuronectes platessa]